jgi:hypothetical protein
MRELTQIDSPAEHDCTGPADQAQRWNILEPVSGRWSWLVVFPCCGRVAEQADEADAQIQQAA